MNSNDSTVLCDTAAAVKTQSTETSLLFHWYDALKIAAQDVMESRGSKGTTEGDIKMGTVEGLGACLKKIREAHNRIFRIIREKLKEPYQETSDPLEESTEPSQWWMDRFAEGLHLEDTAELSTVITLLQSVRSVIWSQRSLIRIESSDFGFLPYHELLTPLSGYEKSLCCHTELRFGKVLVMFDVTIAYEGMALLSLERFLNDLVSKTTTGHVLRLDTIRKYIEDINGGNKAPGTRKASDGNGENDGAMDEMLAAFLGAHDNPQLAFQAGMDNSASNTEQQQGGGINDFNYVKDDYLRTIINQEPEPNDKDSVIKAIICNFELILKWLVERRQRNKGKLFQDEIFLHETLLSEDPESIHVNPYIPPIYCPTVEHDLPKINIKSLKTKSDLSLPPNICDIEDYLAEPHTKNGGAPILSQFANLLVPENLMVNPPGLENESKSNGDTHYNTKDGEDWLISEEHQLDYVAGDLTEAFCFRILNNLCNLLVRCREWYWIKVISDDNNNSIPQSFLRVLLCHVGDTIICPVYTSNTKNTNNRSSTQQLLDTRYDFRKIIQGFGLWLNEPLLERLNRSVINTTSSFEQQNNSNDLPGFELMVLIGYDESLLELKEALVPFYCSLISCTWRIISPRSKKRLWSDNDTYDDLLIQLGVINTMPSDVTAETAGYLSPVLPPTVTYQWLLDPLSEGFNCYVISMIQGVLLSALSLSQVAEFEKDDPRDERMTIVRNSLIRCCNTIEEFQIKHPIMRIRLLKLIIAIATALPSLRSSVLFLLPRVLQKGSFDRVKSSSQLIPPIEVAVENKLGMLQSEKSDNKILNEETHKESDIDEKNKSISTTPNLTDPGIRDIIDNGPFDGNVGRKLWDGGWLIDALPSPNHTSFRFHKGLTPPPILPAVMMVNELQLKEQISNAGHNESNISVVVSAALSTGLAMKDTMKIAEELDSELNDNEDKRRSLDSIGWPTDMSATELLDSMTMESSSPWDPSWLVADILVPQVSEFAHQGIPFRTALSKLSLGDNQGAPLGDLSDCLSLFHPENYLSRTWPKEDSIVTTSTVNHLQNSDFQTNLELHSTPPNPKALNKVVPHWHSWGNLERHFLLQGAFQDRIPPVLSEDSSLLGIARLISRWFSIYDRIDLNLVATFMEVICKETYPKDSLIASSLNSLYYFLGANRLPIMPLMTLYFERRTAFLSALSSVKGLRYNVAHHLYLHNLISYESSLLKVMDITNGIYWFSAIKNQEVLKAEDRLNKTLNSDSFSILNGLDFAVLHPSVIQASHAPPYGVYLYGHALSSSQLCLPSIRMAFINLQFYKIRLAMGKTLDFHCLSKTLTKLGDSVKYWIIIAVETVKVWMSLSQTQERVLPGIPPFKPTNQRTSAGFLTLPDVASLSHITDILRFFRNVPALRCRLISHMGDNSIENRTEEANSDMAVSQVVEYMMQALSSIGPLALWLLSMKVRSPRSLQDFAFGLRFIHIKPIPESCKVAVAVEPNYLTVENERKIVEKYIKDLCSLDEATERPPFSAVFRMTISLVRTICLFGEGLIEHLMPSSYGYLDPLRSLYWDQHATINEEMLDEFMSGNKITTSDENIVEENETNSTGAVEGDSMKKPATTFTSLMATEDDNGDDQIYDGIDGLETMADTIADDKMGSNCSEASIIKMHVAHWGKSLIYRLDQLIRFEDPLQNDEIERYRGVLNPLKNRLLNIREKVLEASAISTGLPQSLLPHDFVSTSASQ